jgi:hypothetical protein
MTRKFDIFKFKEEYPLPDDNHAETFKDLDGNEVQFTPSRLIPMMSNAVAGHHSLCGVPECDEIEHPDSVIHRIMAQEAGQPAIAPVMVARCWIEGPTTPERQAANKSIDERIEQHMREEYPGMKPFLDQTKKTRRMGFDIHRDES